MTGNLPYVRTLEKLQGCFDRAKSTEGTVRDLRIAKELLDAGRESAVATQGDVEMWDELLDYWNEFFWENIDRIRAQNVTISFTPQDVST